MNKNTVALTAVAIFCTGTLAVELVADRKEKKRKEKIRKNAQKELSRFISTTLKSANRIHEANMSGKRMDWEQEAINIKFDDLTFDLKK